jgi:F-type H+-transporting ATPase subunit alpha
MAAFAQFGSDLDKATQDKLAQGERLMDVLKQPQFSPYAVEEQTAILFLAVNGSLMDVAVNKIATFVKGFLEYLRIHGGDVLETIAGTGVLTPELEQKLVSAIESYKQLKQ